MLPSEDALWVGEELARRFGLPRWQFALTATDANRFAIRLARELTGRPKILVFNWCYHGTVDETFATLDGASTPYGFRVFRHAWKAAPGQYQIASRATDSNGMAQPETPVWNPGGYLHNAIEQLKVEVRS